MIISILCSLKGTIYLFLVEGKLCVKCLLLFHSSHASHSQGKRDLGEFFNKIRCSLIKQGKSGVFCGYNYYVLIFQGCMVQSSSLLRKASPTDAHYPPHKLSSLLQGQRQRENDTMLILFWLFLVLMCVINSTLIILLTFPHFAPSSWWDLHFSARSMQKHWVETPLPGAFLFWCSGHETYICLRNTGFYATHYSPVTCILMYGLPVSFIHL